MAKICHVLQKDADFIGLGQHFFENLRPLVVQSGSEIPDTKPDPTGPDTIPVLVSFRSVSDTRVFWAQSVPCARAGQTFPGQTLHHPRSLISAARTVAAH